MLTVEKAAIKSAVDGKVISVDRPGRHHDVIRIMVEKGYPKPIKGEQGFVLSNGVFARRRASYVVAKRADQIIRSEVNPNYLTSEDVW